MQYDLVELVQLISIKYNQNEITAIENSKNSIPVMY